VFFCTFVLYSRFSIFFLYISSLFSLQTKKKKMLGPMTFITIGDEYDKKDTVPDRFKGKNMMTSAAPHRGFVNDSCFQKKVLSLSEYDRYVDPGYYEKRYRIENEKKKVVPMGFRYTNPSHKSTGAGDYFGTFSEKNHPEYQPHFKVDEAADAKKVLSMPKNILVVPPKKGSYGFPGTSIGGKDGQLKYISDPYDGQKRADALTAKTTKAQGPPFKAACRHQDFFDETTHGCPKVYTIDRPLPAKSRALSESSERKKPVGAAWRPGGVLVGIITKPPAYEEDPYELREKKVREERLKREKAFKPGQAWRPIGGTKSLPVKPIKFYPS
jgi:hypothetical protein